MLAGGWRFGIFLLDIIDSVLFVSFDVYELLSAYLKTFPGKLSVVEVLWLACLVCCLFFCSCYWFCFLYFSMYFCLFGLADF